MSGYFDPLLDVLPQEVVDAMHRACASATHHGTGRDGEPALIAGVRALVQQAVVRAEHDREIQRLVQVQRADAAAWAEQLRQRVDEAGKQCQEERLRLDRVRALVDFRRKTVRVEDLQEALDTPITHGA
jgi:hypothetical protein